MTPDTRENLMSRADQIAYVARALEVAKAPKSTRNDGEHHLSNMDMIECAIFTCTYDDVVVRAVTAANRNGGWGADLVAYWAAEREKLNALRAANKRKYGGSK